MAGTMVFRTTFSRVFPWVTAAVAVAGMVAMVADGGWPQLWRSGPALVLAVTIVWVLFALPRVEVSDAGVLLVNVTRTVWVAWPNFRSASTEWSLRVRTVDDREFSSWALPASSGSLRRLPGGGTRVPRGSAPAERSDRADRAGVSVAGRGTRATEAAALEIGRRVRDLTEAGFLPACPEAPVQVGFNARPLLVLAGIAVITAASALWA